MLDVVITTHPAAPVVYRVGMSEPQSHEYEIQMDVPALPGRETVDLVFPAWAPGSYLVRDFVRHVYRLEITDADGRAPVPRALPRVRLRAERAHVLPRREPRLLERHQRVLLRRR
jgi:predicted metalloprotease with PDZ domain